MGASAPYVAAAAVYSQEQMAQCLWLSDQLSKISPRRRMAGAIQTSHWSLHDRSQVKFAKRFPPLQELASWLPKFDYIQPGADRQEIHIHYSPGSNADAMTDDLRSIGDAIGQHVHGLQVNYSMPYPGMLEEWLLRFPKHRIILPVTPKMTDSGRTPIELAEELHIFYSGLVTDILLDSSGGRGISLEAESALPWLEEIQHVWPEVRLGVAGGLGPQRLSGYARLLKRFPGLNLDAERHLLYAEDEGLDLARVRQFVIEVAHLDHRQAAG